MLGRAAAGWEGGVALGFTVLLLAGHPSCYWLGTKEQRQSTLQPQALPRGMLSSLAMAS